MDARLKPIALCTILIAILFCTWAKPLDTRAMTSVNDGFKRATASFGTGQLGQHH